MISKKLKLVKSPIISCSRRTDIPAFLMEWIIKRIQDGFVDVVNPFNKKQISRVSLSPEHVKCVVWWSKNYNDWIKAYNDNTALFNRYKAHVFHFTINSPSELERYVKISLEERFTQLKWLIDKFSDKAINFRYDPIIFYKKQGENQIFNNLEKFKYIIENVSALGVKEVIFSFATIYPKVKKRMISNGFIPIDLPQGKKVIVLKSLIKTCQKYDMLMKACCQPELLSIEGVEQAHCIDAYRIQDLIGEDISKKRDTGQRKFCGCYKSKDIGGYSGIFLCKHKCLYCYASPIKS
jgi:hypothetical protein